MFDYDQEQLAQRKTKLNILLNRNTRRAFCFHQHKIIKQIIEPPKRVFSYSRSIRHFQEIMQKTGIVSLNGKAKTLFMKNEQSEKKDSIRDFLKSSKLIQTDDLIQDEYGFKTDRTQSVYKRESPYIKTQKFSQHSHNSPYLQRILDNNETTTPRVVKEFTFQNEVLQNKVPKLASTHFRTTYSHSQHKKQQNLDSIFTTIAHTQRQ